MRKRGIRRALKKEFRKVNENALSKETRTLISGVLKETMEKFRADSKATEGIKRAFEQTILTISLG